MPDDWEPGHDWSPEPDWGPAPVGWTLWRRERRAAWLLRHRRSAGLGSAAVLTIFVALAGPPASGTFEQPGAGAAMAPPPTGAALVPQQDHRPGTEPVVRLQRRTPEATSVRRPATVQLAATTRPTTAVTAHPGGRRLPAGNPGPEPSTSLRRCPPASPAPGEASVSPTPGETSTTGSGGANDSDLGHVQVVSHSSGCPGSREGRSPSPTTSGWPEPPG
jgi:hypothetical protein